MVRLSLRNIKRHERGKMNQTESKFAQLLEICKRTETPIPGIEGAFPAVPFRWKFEPISLTLSDPSNQYRPDFYVVTCAGQGLFFEIKPRRTDGKVIWQDASKIKFKTAAAMYDEYRWFCASYAKQGGWLIEETGE